MSTRPKKIRYCAGALTAEFAIVLILFLAVVCAVIELSRVLYMLNTLQVVTQRAAAGAADADYSSAAAMNVVRRRAIFRNSAGTLAVGAPVTDAYVRIDYLSLSGAGGATSEMTVLPSCPANNRVNCMQDPYGASCIRLVRARICDPAVAGECRKVAYQPLFSFISLPFNLPRATAVATAETLGAPPGQAPCP